MSTPGFMLGPNLLGKVRSTIARVEGEPIVGGRWTIPTRFEGEEAAIGKPFRICTFTGEWDKNSSKVVTFKYQTSTPNTASALNLFADIGTASGSRNCAIAREGTAWFLIAAEC